MARKQGLRTYLSIDNIAVIATVVSPATTNLLEPYPPAHAQAYHTKNKQHTRMRGFAYVAARLALSERNNVRSLNK